MPFDIAEARKAITALEAHQRHPGGEAMLKGANLLKEALADATMTMAAIRNAEAEVVKIKGEFNTLLLEMKILRDKEPLNAEAIKTLQLVAVTKKGASKLAADWLATKNLLPAPAA